jgi:uncharacterized protein YdgA (DUF945 family)
MIDYVKISIIAGICAVVFGSCWWMGYSRYIEYKKQVEIAAKTQEAKVESIQKQHELVTKGISDEFDAKLSLIRQYYSNGVRQPSTSSVSSISSTASIANASTAYAELAGNCAQTTLQLIELQKWYMEVAGIK